MSWASTVPDVITDLQARFAAALPATLVVVGPQVTQTGDLEAITIGPATDTDPVSAEGETAVEGFAGQPNRETYTVTCQVAVRNGDARQMPAATARAFELLAGCGQALAADPKLGGLVLVAHPGTWSLSQRQDTRGALSVLTFTVAVEAYTKE